MEPDATKDFFISYDKADRAWAAWIAWQLEEKGFSTVLEDWDVRPGDNAWLRRHEATQRAARTIAVLSPDYFASRNQQAEWSAAFGQDPTGASGKLLPVRVRDCQPPGLLTNLQYIDLVDRDEEAACAELLAGVERARAKPQRAPTFPGASATQPTPAFPATWPEIWNLPYQRNPFFTGRDELLTRLHDQLFVNGAAALSQPQAISGLGGIGKTQSAIEYAYRHSHEYRYVLWALADSRESLLTAYSAIAALVQAPGYDERDQRSAVPAVKNWLLQHANWLLILDNADDIAIAAEFLPTGARLPGHILLTTRAQATGAIARRVAVEKMGQREGEELLLKRSKARERGNGRISRDERRAAASIARAMDGLPLALAQAGAYIEENTCSLADYWRLYQQRRSDLLAWRSRLARDYPASVATAWDLTFRRIEQEDPAAADLLRFCAFLAPDAIPEEIITEGAEHLGENLAPVAADPIKLNAAIQLLLRYSLIQRDAAKKTLMLHRLVQAVVQDSLDEAGRHLWAESAVEAVNMAFSFRAYETITEFERFLPHALVCANWIERYRLVSSAAWRLLNHAGRDIHMYARYAEAEVLLTQALKIARQVFGENHRNTAATLHNLAWLYMDQQHYNKAEPLFKQAMHVLEQDSEVMDQPTQRAHYIAKALTGLANLYRKQNSFYKAREYYERSLHIQREDLGTMHPDTAITLHNLAALYYDQGNVRSAEELYRRALDILESGREFGAEPLDIATTQYNLARLCHDQGRYAEAEGFYKEALRTQEKALGAKHPDTIRTMREYAGLLREMGRGDEAAALEARIGRG